MKTVIFLIVVVFIHCQFARAQSGDAAKADAVSASAEVLAGHSYHGDAFNEGPRQQAYLMDGLTHVEFAVSTDSPETQQFVTQGVSQLHGFWYFEAERSFRQAAASDPDCAMTYWGMAMANRNNQDRAKGFVAAAVSRKKNVSEREKKYIDGLNEYLTADPEKKEERSKKYTKALEEIVYEHPDDLEAKAFLIVQLWNNRNDGLPITSYLAVDALIEQILAVEPMHPVHHYRIHLWDYERPQRAVASAARCGQSLPAIAHMWHMPGHTFSRLKRYQDAAWQQEASARVDHAHMMKDRVMPDQIHNFAHNNEWLIRNLNHVGRVHDAIDLAKNMIELPRHPKYNTVAKRGSANYGRTRMFETLERFELWDETISMAGTSYLDPTENEDEQIKRLRYLGQAFVRSGKSKMADAQLAELREQLKQKRVEEKETKAAISDDEDSDGDKEAGSTEEKDSKTGDNKKIGKPSTDKSTEKKQDEQETKESKKKKEALRKVRATIRKLEKAIKAIEGHQAVARGEYEQGWKALKEAGGVEAIYRAKVQLLAGKPEEALKAAREHVKTHDNEVQPLAKLVELLWFAEQHDEARESFKQLRKIAAVTDLDTPVFQRVASIAETLGYGPDWPEPAKLRDDIGERPSLGSLGPFRWEPSPAPDWSLVDHESHTYSLEQFQGQPLLLIFYLGYGCLHCAEQLQAFAPMSEQFQDAGIQILAISTDDEAGLQVSIANFDEPRIPFPLLSDAKLRVFRNYRAFDDFEDLPLHGTFLIDGRGRVRWQDISYEPFMDAEFLLTESQRLLGQ
jgi:peroxiredoxin